MIFHITPLYTAFSTHFWYSEGLPYFVSVDSLKMKFSWNSSLGKCLGACCLKLSTIWLTVCRFPHCLIQNSVIPLINDFVSSTVGALFHTTSIIIFFFTSLEIIDLSTEKYFNQFTNVYGFHLVYTQIYSLSSLLLWQFLSSTLHCSQRQKWRVYSNGTTKIVYKV